MAAGVQPGLQAGFRMRQVDVRDAHVGETEFRAPGLDGACELVQVGWGCQHGGMNNMATAVA